jgi:hypothetical protein
MNKTIKLYRAQKKTKVNEKKFIIFLDIYYMANMPVLPKLIYKLNILSLTFEYKPKSHK